MSDFPAPQAWQTACAIDPALAVWQGDWTVAFALIDGPRTWHFAFAGGRITDGPGDPAFTLAAPAAAWAAFRAPVPPRHHHAIFAMLARVPGAVLSGDRLSFMRYAHVVRRVLDIGRHLARGGSAPVPVSLRPAAPPAPPPDARGAYASVTARGTAYRMYHETAGQEGGQSIPLLCLHTAGSDARQFHRLMADPWLAQHFRLIAPDLPFHGKSPPPAGAVPGSWRLDTDLYVALVMDFIRATGIDRPVLLGASMSGEICLELALRHPESFRAIVACEACEQVPNRQTGYSAHPEINQGYFVPEWIEGLMAPQSPAECAAEILWHYAQSGPAVFHGDIAFYSGDWDGRGRIGRIDTNRCPLFMLTGEYDYSCTAEMSAATAAQIPGATFRRMDGIGHFPFAENPARFLDYLRPVLQSLPGVPA
ncbi:MAG: alpha/beta hydrolase [Rhodospirillales bacterium]|nr:alpha/beta hydrolase [Rhodospirillales bacterium]